MSTNHQAESQSSLGFVALFQQQPAVVASLLDALASVVVVLSLDGQIVHCNHVLAQLLSRFRHTTVQQSERSGNGSAHPRMTHIWDFAPDRKAAQKWRLAVQQWQEAAGEPAIAPSHEPTVPVFQRAIPYLSPPSIQLPIADGSGSAYWVAWTVNPVWDQQGELQYLLLTGQDITAERQAEAQDQEEMSQERALWQLTRWSMEIAHLIHASLDFQNILSTAVREIQNFLRVDRVCVYQFKEGESAQFIEESLAPGYPSLLGRRLHDPCFEQAYCDRYAQGRTSTIDNVETEDIQPCYAELLQQMQVRALLIVPIVYTNKLWGLLCAHQCSAPRHWQDAELHLMQHLASQLAIALHQSELYGQIQHLNAELESQVQERTAQLEQALTYETILKRITDRVRDSLDEQQILQTAVYELGTALDLDCCDAGMYNANHSKSVIAYEFCPHLPSALGQQFVMADAWDIYRNLLEGISVQFCDLTPSRIRPVNPHSAVLASPMMDGAETLGDLWLFKAGEQQFDDQEVRLVNQVANQCAIAIRQARLHQVTETQVDELANLIRLKDEFLSRVSHELRTPVTSMKMAIQMLGIALNQEYPLLAELSKPQLEQNKIAGYFRVLRDECQREISLLNDLLDMQNLDMGRYETTPRLIDLPQWLPPIIEPFQERTLQGGQRFSMEMDRDLPPLFSSAASLERIIWELLDNACKYTPAQEAIQLQVWATDHQISFAVSNTGVEIPTAHLSRIFERFYRIPDRDRWEHGGTGLGLALVQKLVKRLGGHIQANSQNNRTAFQVNLPLVAQAPPNPPNPPPHL